MTTKETWEERFDKDCFPDANSPFFDKMKEFFREELKNRTEEILRDVKDWVNGLDSVPWAEQVEEELDSIRKRY